jgi:hypothetical protein
VSYNEIVTLRCCWTVRDARDSRDSCDAMAAR